MFQTADIIHTYTRAQAIDDGVLVDITAYAKEAGITRPVAITCRAYSETIGLPRHCPAGQDLTGRAWDVVWMLSRAMQQPRKSDTLTYAVSVQNNPRRLYRLKAVAGPGDDGEPVITIMFPDED